METSTLLGYPDFNVLEIVVLPSNGGFSEFIYDLDFLELPLTGGVTTWSVSIERASGVLRPFPYFAGQWWRSWGLNVFEV